MEASSISLHRQWSIGCTSLRNRPQNRLTHRVSQPKPTTLIHPSSLQTLTPIRRLPTAFSRITRKQPPFVEALRIGNNTVE